MGISFSMIDRMKQLGLYADGRISALDVGSSNLYSASATEIIGLLDTFGVASTPDNNAFAERLAIGSAYDPVSGGSNESFVGELLEKIGMEYVAIDIADGYKTTILDLNHTPTPPGFRAKFDLVMNFGTTEHLLNQYNAFKVMHDSVKVGGHIVNSLPMVGYSNHGYFTYTPRCLFDLAGYNEYELVACFFEGPGGSNDLYAPIRDYQTYFPKLADTLANRERTEVGRKVGELAIPDVGIVVVYKKVQDREFVGALERSTSVGAVPTLLASGYGGTSTEGSDAAPAWNPSGSRRILDSLRAIVARVLPGAGR